MTSPKDITNKELEAAAEAWARPRCEESGYVQWHNLMADEIETFKAGARWSEERAAFQLDSAIQGMNEYAKRLREAEMRAKVLVEALLMSEVKNAKR